MIITSYLPEKIEKNESLGNLGWDCDKIYKKTGIRQRHISGENEYANDLAINAAKKLFNLVDKNSIEYLIHVTQSPDYIIPSNCCILQNRLGLKKEIGAIDINMGCSGYIYALSVAKGLISSDQVENVMITTSDTYSKIINRFDKSNRVIFGDGATATLITRSDNEKIGKFVFGTDGSGANNLMCKKLGIRYKNSNLEKIVEDKSGNRRSEGDLYMNGPAIFAFTLDNVPELLENIRNKNRLSSNDVGMYILHQANSFMLKAIRDKAGIDPKNFFINLEDTGNTVSSTIPIALEEFLSKKKGLEKVNIILGGFGVGYSWAGVAIEI